MIVVITSSSLALQILHDQTIDSGSTEYKALRSWLEEHNCYLVPTFPQTDAHPLQTYFHLHADTTLTKTQLKSLMDLPGIESVFEKPSDELPG